MQRVITAVVLAALVAAISPSAAQAGILYGATGGSAGSNLYILDQSTGAVLSTVGPIGYAVTGLAFDPTSGTLYGSTTRLSPGSSSSIITINTVTGAGTLVGATNLGPLADIGFNSAGTLYGWSENVDSLASVNLGTGNATQIGTFGQFTRGSGLAFSGSGTLYSAGRIEGILDGALHTINPGTGLSTGTFDVSPDPTDRVNALAFDSATGLMYGSTNANRLITINLTTGAVIDIGPTVTGIDAIAFLETQQVPEPAALTLFGLGGLGLAAVRRRRKA